MTDNDIVDLFLYHSNVEWAQRCDHIPIASSSLYLFSEEQEWRKNLSNGNKLSFLPSLIHRSVEHGTSIRKKDIEKWFSINIKSITKMIVLTNYSVCNHHHQWYYEKCDVETHLFQLLLSGCYLHTKIIVFLLKAWSLSILTRSASTDLHSSDPIKIYVVIDQSNNSFEFGLVAHCPECWINTNDIDDRHFAFVSKVIHQYAWILCMDSRISEIQMAIEADNVSDRPMTFTISFQIQNRIWHSPE